MPILTRGSRGVMRAGDLLRMYRGSSVLCAVPADFTPLSLPGCIQWLRSDMGLVTTIPGGGKVVSWADQSGAGNDYAQGTDAWRPFYIPVNANMGGKPSLQFNSTMLGLQRANFAQGLGAVTTGVYYRRNAVTTSARVFGVATVSGGTYQLVTNGGVGFDAAQNNGGTNMTRVLGDPVNTNVSRIAAFNVANAGTVDPVVYTDGVVGGSVVSSLSTDGIIGAGTWYIGYVFEGDVTETVTYNRILSAGEAALIAAYMNGRYT